MAETESPITEAVVTVRPHTAWAIAAGGAA
jgi:hypothetical protein